MQAQLEARVAELVETIVRQTEQRVEQAFGDALARELHARHNGHAPDVGSEQLVVDERAVERGEPAAAPTEVAPQPSSTRTCVRCGETTTSRSPSRATSSEKWRSTSNVSAGYDDDGGLLVALSTA